MLKLIWNEAYWADHAEEARSIAEKIQNPECRLIVLDMAISYGRLAKLTRDFKSSAGKLTPSE
jgi:hypothetical protein